MHFSSTFSAFVKGNIVFCSKQLQHESDKFLYVR